MSLICKYMKLILYFLLKKLNIKQLNYSPLIFLWANISQTIHHMSNEQKLDKVHRIMDARMLGTVKTLVDHMAAEYAHELIGDPDGTNLFTNPPDFNEQRNVESRRLQTEHMIITHGQCPAFYFLSTPLALGYDDWNLELARLHRTIHADTPSLETMFHQYVDARMAPMEKEHTRLAAYLIYRQTRYVVHAPAHA
jgi:hypothetical protein